MDSPRAPEQIIGVRTGEFGSMGSMSKESLGFTPGLFLPGFLSFMLEGLGEGLLACDQRGALLCANRIAREVFGEELSSSVKVSPRLQHLIGPGADEFPLYRALRGESFQDLDFWYHPAGLLLSFTGGPVRNAAGELFGAVVVFRNIRHAKPGPTGASPEEDRSAFALLACHDLRAPLASIVLLADAAKYETDPRVQGQYLQEAGRIAEQSLSLVDDIFEIAALKREAAPAENVFTLSDLFDRVGRLCRPLAKQKGISLEMESLGAALVGERTQIGRVLQNLITNAIKFTPIGGRVCVRASARGSCLRIAVADNGTGLSRDQIRQVLAGSVKGRREGTAGEKSRGYGLMLVREILKRHGTRLRIASRPGTGSVFFFRLRLA